MYELISCCEEIGTKLRVLKGTITHDHNQLDNFKHLEADATNFRIINNAEYEELMDDLHVLYIPEEYPEDQKEYYSQFFDTLEGGKYDFIFGHGTYEFEAFKCQVFESERPIKSAPVFSEKEFINYCNYSFFNHIHRRSSYKERIFYNGSFSRTAFGEEDPKGFHYIEYDPDKCKAVIKFIVNTDAPTYTTVHIDDIKEEYGSDAVAITKAIKKLKSENFKLRVLTNSKGNSVDADTMILREHFSESDGVVIKNFKGVASNRVVSEDYEFIFSNGDGVIPTVIKFIELKHSKNYTTDVISDCITPDKKSDDDDD
jgi:hypothetical protein